MARVGFRSSNAALRRLESDIFVSEADRSTVKGVAFKALFFVLLSIASAIVTAVLLFQSATQDFIYWTLFPAMIIAFVCSIIAIFVPSTAAICGTMYCVFEGIVVGAVSAILEVYFPGVALMALLSTMGVFAVLQVCYATGIIRVNKLFVSIVVSAAIGLFLFMVASYIISFASPTYRDLFFGDSILALVVAAALVILASCMIVLDLNNIDMMVKNGIHKKYEWSAAFGLILTLIWLYLEFLRLFSIIMSRNSR